MRSFRFTDDPIVKRICRLMMGVMLFSAINTLAGQPSSFWHDPRTAIRFDDLSIHSQTNPMFDFFLGHGWQTYLAATFIYMAAAFLLVSVLPRRAALMTAFPFILGHYYVGSNWLAVRWHFGVQGAVVYGIVLSTGIVVWALQGIGASGPIIKRLRWLMLAAMLVDLTVTLAGQPDSFWHRPETMRESNQLVRIFLMHGWMGFALFAVLFLSGTLLMVHVLPRTIALIWVFAATLGGFSGASNWFFYDWRMGIQTPLLYGAVLSIGFVALAFAAPEHRAKSSSDILGSADGKRPRWSTELWKCGQTGC